MSVDLRAAEHLKAKPMAASVVTGLIASLCCGGSLIFASVGLGNPMILESVITCPHCAYKAAETMPTDACQFFYNCEACGARLKPKTGDCCVFCSYGSVPCPPIQAERPGEAGAASCCAG